MSKRVIDPEKCTFCEKAKPDNGMRLCEECGDMADEAIEELDLWPWPGYVRGKK